MSLRTANVREPSRMPMGMTVPPEFEREIRERVASGRYASPAEVFAACLELLRRDEEEDEATLEWLRATIDEGIAGLDRGEKIDGPTALASIREELRRKVCP